jgi:hypothetical protein
MLSIELGTAAIADGSDCIGASEFEPIGGNPATGLFSGGNALLWSGFAERPGRRGVAAHEN